jgi:hypothetical protein
MEQVPGAFFLGIKWPGREADHSSPSSAEVKNAWSCTSTPPICLHGVVLSYSSGTALPLLYLLQVISDLVHEEDTKTLCTECRILSESLPCKILDSLTSFQERSLGGGGSETTTF